MNRPPGVAVVASPGDALAERVTEGLGEAGRPIVSTRPGRLADLTATLDDSTFRVDGRPIRSILFRATPSATFSDSFVEGDRGFCDTETRAIWAAAVHLEGVQALNSWEPWVWFGSAGWGDWRRAMAEAGLPPAPFAFGDPPDAEHRHWYTYRGSTPQPPPGAAACRALGTAVTTESVASEVTVVCGAVVAGEPPPGAERLEERLRGLGLEIASVAFDGEGRVLALDPLPLFRSSGAVKRASDRVVEAIDGHLRRR